MELWIGWVAGALKESEFRALLAEVGFEGADIEPTRIYEDADARVFLEKAGIDVSANLDEIERSTASSWRGASWRPSRSSRWPRRRGRPPSRGPPAP